MNNRNKIISGSALGAVFFCISKAFAQTNQIAVPVSLTDTQANIVAAAWHQVINNPASLTVIPFLCVFAWLVDDLPFINSRYVPHLTVILGGAIYSLFAGPESVPKTFPYPFMVLVANGTLCGFISYITHRQLVARAINFFREKQQNQNP